MKDKKTMLSIIAGVLVVLLLIGVQISTICGIATMKLNEKKQLAEYYGQDIANVIQLSLDNTLEATETLKYFYLQYGEDCFSDFEDIASKIAADNPIIGSMYIAPEGVIQIAYPKAVNEATIGFEMLRDPEQGPRAQLALDTRQITVAGPHELIEGGVGFIIRNPVFDGDEFLGFTIIVLDWNRMVEKVLDNIKVSSESYKFAVWKNDHDETAVTDDDGYIFRNVDEPISNLVDIEFEVPNDTWHLIIEPKDGWSVSRDLIPSILISIFINVAIALIALSLYHAHKKDLKLKQELAKNEAKSLYVDQLAAARDAAEAANVAKSNFLLSISHDIRTPMNAIVGFTHLIKTNKTDEKLVDEYIDKIEQSGDYMMTLINNVLDMARIESGKVEVNEEFVDLLDRTNLTETLLTGEFEKKNINFTSTTDIKHRYILADIPKCNQIMMNILSNAIKYTPEGGQISKEMREVESERPGYARYITSIKDTGIGMSEEFKEQIFDSFTRERTTTESKVMGTGLGMSIVKRTLDLMDGTIEIESAPGKGSTFTITMDFKIVDKPELFMTQNIESSENQVSIIGRRILLAEDNDLNAEIAIAILDDAEIITERARDGAICVDMLTKAEAGYYDLVLMDIQMPNMNGYEACKAIRALDDPYKANIPVVAMTANAFTEDKVLAFEAGMNGHVSKPVNVSKLMATIAEALR